MDCLGSDNVRQSYGLRHAIEVKTVQSYSARCGKQLYSTRAGVGGAAMKQFQPLAPSSTRRPPLRPRQSSDAGTKKFRPLVARSSTPPRPPGARVGAVAAVTSRFLTGGAVARTKYRAPVLAGRAPPRSPRPPPGAPPSPETQEPDAPPTPPTAPPVTTPVVVMHNACVERHLVPAGHQERPERTASARRVAQNVVRRRPAAVGGAWAAGASVSGGDVTAAILRAHSARYYASLEAARRARDLAGRARRAHAGGRHPWAAASRSWPRARPSLLV